MVDCQDHEKIRSSGNYGHGAGSFANAIMSELASQLKEPVITTGNIDPTGKGIEHPAHYNQHPSGVECIDIIEWFTANVANAVKYCWRAGLKSPNAIEDLKKARWYIDREIARLERKPK